MPKNLWTREELILTFNLYFTIPFGQFHKGNPKVKELAELIGRSPSSISMRLSNFANVDPYHAERGVKGLSNGRRQVEPIWEEFNNNREVLLFESEEIRAFKENTTIDEKYDHILSDTKELYGINKTREVKTRVNQEIFRKRVLSNYSSKCAITNIDIPELLVASHIIPWADNEKERLNPANGICMSSLYDKAFDKGFIGINSNYQIIISEELKKKEVKEYYNEHFLKIEKQRISNPLAYQPKKEFLEFHMDTIFNRTPIIL